RNRPPGVRLADEPGRPPGLLDQLLDREQGALAGLEAGRPPQSGGDAALALLAPTRGELLADHPQRQELVALHAQDVPQALDVGLAVEAVAAPGSPRGEQLLVLRGAGLRDRDVVELAAEDLGDGADRERLAVRARPDGVHFRLRRLHAHFSR